MSRPRPRPGRYGRPAYEPVRHRRVAQPPEPLPEPEPELSPLARLLVDRGGAAGPQGAQLQAARWQQHGFAAERVAAWLSAGLRSGEFSLAAQMQEAGISPTLATRRIHNQKVLDRVRAGRPLTEVRTLLLREGLLPAVDRQVTAHRAAGRD